MTLMLRLDWDIYRIPRECLVGDPGLNDCCVEEAVRRGLSTSMDPCVAQLPHKHFFCDRHLIHGQIPHVPATDPNLGMRYRTFHSQPPGLSVTLINKCSLKRADSNSVQAEVRAPEILVWLSQASSQSVGLPSSSAPNPYAHPHARC